MIGEITQYALFYIRNDKGKCKIIVKRQCNDFIRLGQVTKKKGANTYTRCMYALSKHYSMRCLVNGVTKTG